MTEELEKDSVIIVRKLTLPYDTSTVLVDVQAWYALKTAFL